MWTFLAALAGGLVALLGSVVTTYYVQRQAVKAERRARATRAADEILAAVTALRELSREPAESSDPTDIDRRQAWSDKKESLIYRIMAQAVLIPRSGFQERLKFAAEPTLYASLTGGLGGITETEYREVFCTEVLDCLGAFYRGNPLPPVGKATTQARAVIEQFVDLEDT